MPVWQQAIIAGVGGIPSAIAAYFAYRSNRSGSRITEQLVTGNEKTVGEMVAEVHGKESAQSTDYETHS